MTLGAESGKHELSANYRLAQAIADGLVDRGYGCEAGTNEWVEEIEKALDAKDSQHAEEMGKLRADRAKFPMGIREYEIVEKVAADCINEGHLHLKADNADLKATLAEREGEIARLRTDRSAFAKETQEYRDSYLSDQKNIASLRSKLAVMEKALKGSA